MSQATSIGATSLSSYGNKAKGHPVVSSFKAKAKELDPTKVLAKGASLTK